MKGGLVYEPARATALFSWEETVVREKRGH